MRPPPNFSLYPLLVAVAGARLCMQMIAMPPYAGLDELYHVARLAFVAEEHRNPAASERSVPPYLEATLERRPDAVPSFAILQDRWRDAPPIRDRALTARDLHPYTRPNHEAQQPGAYYSALAPLARAGRRTILGELRRWRFASVMFGLVTVVAIAMASASGGWDRRASSPLRSSRLCPRGKRSWSAPATTRSRALW